jgi:hypothetical protein
LPRLQPSVDEEGNHHQRSDETERRYPMVTVPITGEGFRYSELALEIGTSAGSNGVTKRVICTAWSRKPA